MFRRNSAQSFYHAGAFLVRRSLRTGRWATASILLSAALLATPTFGQAVFSNIYFGSATSLDGSVGLNVNKTYLNAVNLFGPALTINSVNFAASGGTNPSGANWSTSGFPNTFPTASNPITGQLGSLLVLQR